MHNAGTAFVVFCFACHYCWPTKVYRVQCTDFRENHSEECPQKIVKETVGREKEFFGKKWSFGKTRFGRIDTEKWLGTRGYY